MSHKKDGEEEKRNEKEEERNRDQVAWAVNIHLFYPWTLVHNAACSQSPARPSPFCPRQCSITHMLPLVQDERPIPQEELQWERFRVRPG